MAKHWIKFASNRKAISRVLERTSTHKPLVSRMSSQDMSLLASQKTENKYRVGKPDTGYKQLPSTKEDIGKEYEGEQEEEEEVYTYDPG